MSDSYRIETDFAIAWGNTQKRMMRQERRPAVTNATQILGPGAAPFAVQINDWNEEEGTFTGVFCSVPGAMNAPDTQGDPAGTPSVMSWIGETFGCEADEGDRFGFQRLTRVAVAADAVGDPPASWAVYHRRFFPRGDLFGYTDWELA